MRTAKTLIRPGGCSGWSESLLGAQPFCWFCHEAAQIVIIWMLNHRHIFHTIPSEPPQDKTNKMACAPSEDSDQPGHPPSLIRAFTVRMKKSWFLSYPLSAQRRLWSDWADAQSFCWICHEAAHFSSKQITPLQWVYHPLLILTPCHGATAMQISKCRN